MRNENFNEIFDTLEYQPSENFDYFKKMMKERDGYSNNLSNWVEISSNFNNILLKFLENERDNYEAIIDMQNDFNTIKDGSINSVVEKKILKLFKRYDNKMEKELNLILKNNYHDTRELYSAWVELSVCFYDFFNDEDLPDPEIISSNLREFHCKSKKLSLEKIEMVNNNIADIKKIINDYIGASEDICEETLRSGDEERQDYLKKFCENLNEMQRNINMCLEDVQERYRSSITPFINDGSVRPFLPWIASKEMDSYEHGIEKMRKTIQLLEKGLK